METKEMEVFNQYVFLGFILELLIILIILILIILIIRWVYKKYIGQIKT